MQSTDKNLIEELETRVKVIVGLLPLPGTTPCRELVDLANVALSFCMEIRTPLTIEDEPRRDSDPVGMRRFRKRQSPLTDAERERGAWANKIDGYLSRIASQQALEPDFIASFQSLVNGSTPSVSTALSKEADGRNDWVTSKWLDGNTSVSGQKVRSAISKGASIKTSQKNGEPKKYFLPDIECHFGRVVNRIPESPPIAARR